MLMLNLIERTCFYFFIKFSLMMQKHTHERNEIKIKNHIKAIDQKKLSSIDRRIYEIKKSLIVNNNYDPNQK